MKKLVFFKLALILLAFSFGLFFFEIFLKIATPKPENLAKLEASSLFLHENKANADFKYGGGEFSTDVHLNNFGFRDYDFTQNKDSDTLRIAVIGDSFEEALQVNLEDSWQKVMARQLTQSFGKKVESYNFGISGYGTDQNWLTLREKVWQFSPDLIILAFSPNDIGDTYKNKLIELKNGQIGVITQKQRTGGNILGNFARETYTYHLIIKASAANPLAKRIVDKIRTKILGFPREERFFLSDAQLSQGPFEIIASQKNPPAEVIQVWEIVKALISDMDKQAKDHNAHILLTVNIPGPQVNQLQWEALRDQYNLDRETAVVNQINLELGNIAKETNVNFYDGRDDALAWQQKFGDIHFKTDGHYNENGHKFMGTKLAEFIINSKVFN